MSKQKVGVVVARFQTPYLHKGHTHILKQVCDSHQNVIIMLGVSPALYTKKNPFDFQTRKGMVRKFLKKKFPNVNISVLPLPDNKSDKSWAESIDIKLRSAFTNRGFILYGSRDSCLPYYRNNGGTFETQEIECVTDISATEIREQSSDIVSPELYDSVEFRMGVNYGIQNQYDKVYPTVDIAVLKTQNRKPSEYEILLCRKPNSETWCVCGGFVDTTDNNYEEAALRELREECGINLTVDKQVKYEGSFKINDWRYKNTNDGIMTMLFTTEYVFGRPSPHDDIVECNWFNMAELEKCIEPISMEHRKLVRFLTTKYITNAGI